MAKRYNESRVALKYTTTNAKNETETSVKVLTEKQANETLEEAKKDPSSTQPEVAKMATFTYVEAESAADFSQLVPNEQELVNIFNRGYVLKQQSIIRDYMTDDEWAAPDVPVDLQADAAEVRERRKASPAEKAMKALSALSPDEIAAILSQFQAAQTA